MPEANTEVADNDRPEPADQVSETNKRLRTKAKEQKVSQAQRKPTHRAAIPAVVPQEEPEPPDDDEEMVHTRQHNTA